MRYLALTIAINGEVPNHREGLMKTIADYLTDEKKGYHFTIVHDALSRPRGFYLFETNNPKEHNIDEFKKFLNGLKKEGVIYELTPLKDISELLKKLKES